MQKIHCRTNLDLCRETWPSELPRIPYEGEEIQSMTKHGVFRLSLTVVKVRWVYDEDGYFPEIELHDRHNRSIHDFYGWYAPLVRERVSTFI